MLVRQHTIAQSITQVLSIATQRLFRARHFLRPFSTNSHSQLMFIPHAFPSDTAATRFFEADQKRIFAPRLSKTNQLVTHATNPLKKSLIPFYGINAEVARTTYDGQYGINRTETTTTYDDKGNATTTTTTHTDWYNISGILGGCSYTPVERDMLIAGGFTWNSATLEEALSGYKFVPHVKPFDANNIASDIFIDPFIKRYAYAREMANDRVRSAEKDRIREDIRRRVSCDEVSVSSCQIEFSHFHLTSVLLPAYVLEYSNCPPRVLPAISTNDTNVYGAAPVSAIKVTLATTFVTSLIAAAFPTVAFAARLASVIGTSVVSAVWASTRLNARSLFQERKLIKEKEQNETIAATLADQARFEATSRNFLPIQDAETILQIDKHYYTTMGLDPNKPVTEEMIREAFNTKIKTAHPDIKSGTNEAAEQLITARKKFLTELQQNKPPKRNFSTMAKVTVRVKEPPRSMYDANANTLINTVLVKKDYKTALALVKSDQVHPDGHNRNENTLLTKAAECGDIAAIKFAVDDLKASVDTSCDCPHHNTALHYGVQRGDAKVVETLLERKANPNLINSLGETPLDRAIILKKNELIPLLSRYGAIQHTTLPNQSVWSHLRHTLFGYSSRDRTILLEGKKTETIHLPPGKKPT